MIDLNSFCRLLDQNVKQHISKIIDLMQNICFPSNIDKLFQEFSLSV